MKVKLSVSGGFIPINKEAELETDITNKELNALLKTIAYKKSNNNLRDGKSYHIEANGKKVVIDIHNVPNEHKELFDSLLSGLKRVE